MGPQDEDKRLVWLHGEVRTPPMSAATRIEMGFLLRLLQQGSSLSMPLARPLRSIGQSVYELRVRDGDTDWRLVYRTDDDAIVIADVFAKKSRTTPRQIIEASKKRLRGYDAERATKG